MTDNREKIVDGIKMGTDMSNPNVMIWHSYLMDYAGNKDYKWELDNSFKVQEPFVLPSVIVEREK